MNPGLPFSFLYKTSLKSLRFPIFKIGEFSESMSIIDLSDQIMSFFILRSKIKREGNIVVKTILHNDTIPIGNCYDFAVMAEFKSHKSIIKNGIHTKSGYSMFGYDEVIRLYSNKHTNIYYFSPQNIVYYNKSASIDDFISCINHTNNILEQNNLVYEYHKSIDDISCLHIDLRVYLCKCIYLDCEYLINNTYLNLLEKGYKNFYFDKCCIHYS